MNIDVALKEWWKNWMMQILDVTPLVSNYDLKNTFEYENKSFEYSMILEVSQEQFLLYVKSTDPNFPDQVVPFSVQGKTATVQDTIKYIEFDINSIIIINKSSDGEVIPESSNNLDLQTEDEAPVEESQPIEVKKTIKKPK